MKLAILGATGGTGIELVKQALARGHDVTAILRDPTKLQEIANANPNLKIEKCNLLNADELAKSLSGHDAVLSGLGAPGVHFSAITFYQDSAKSMVEAMRKAGVKRLLCVTAFYTKPNPSYPYVYKFLLRPMIGRQLDSMFVMEEYIFKEAQDIDYTIVRPPRLLDGPLSTKTIKVKEDDYFFPDYSTGNQIPRANVAQFMLDEVEANKYVKKAVAVDLEK